MGLVVGLDWLDLDFFFIIVFSGRSQKLSSAQKCAPGFWVRPKNAHPAGAGSAPRLESVPRLLKNAPVDPRKPPMLSWVPCEPKRTQKTPLQAHGGGPPVLGPMAPYWSLGGALLGPMSAAECRRQFTLVMMHHDGCAAERKRDFHLSIRVAGANELLVAFRD